MKTQKKAYIVLSKGDLLYMLKKFKVDALHRETIVTEEISLSDEIDCYQIASADLVINFGRTSPL